MKDKYYYLNFQAEKTIEIFFLASYLNRGTIVFVFTRTLYFCYISLIILYC